MSEIGHGDRKYIASQRLNDLAVSSDLRLERRRIQADLQSSLTLECTEVVITIAGRSMARRTGNGDRQQTFAQPGTSWICPIGTYERDIELTEPIECLHIYLPPTLVEQSALADYDIDPAKTELAYAGGFFDPMLYQIGGALSGLLARSLQPTDRLFVDGMRTALAACLLRNYTTDSWQPPATTPALDAKRLKRVLGYIDAHLADEITLDRLAAEASSVPFISRACSATRPVFRPIATSPISAFRRHKRNSRSIGSRWWRSHSTPALDRRTISRESFVRLPA